MREKRGAFYGFWCLSHRIGAALTFVLTALVVSSIVSIAPRCGIVDSIGCGGVSGQFFNSRRNLPAFLFGVMNCTSIGPLLFGPPGLVWLDMAAMGIYGIATGALLVWKSAPARKPKPQDANEA